MRRSCYTVILAFVVATAAVSPVRADPRIEVYGLPFRLAACDDTDTFLIYNGGDGVLDWSITCDDSWFWVEPSSGSNDPGQENGTTVTIHVDRTGLTNGTYTSYLRITSNDRDINWRVDMAVQDTPKLRNYATYLTFSIQHPDESFYFFNDGVATMSWSVSSTVPWIDLAPPTSGTLGCTERTDISLTLDPGSLPSQNQQHAGEILVSTNGGDAVISVVYLPPAPGPGMIRAYEDQYGTDCDFEYEGAALVPVYFIHTETDGATASQWAAPMPACWTNAIYTGEIQPMPVDYGNTQTGISLSYGGCLYHSILLVTVNYFVFGPPDQNCCLYPVIPDPDAPTGQIEIVDCSFVKHAGRGGIAVVNADASCSCQQIVSVKETTWGQVKALYRGQ